LHLSRRTTLKLGLAAIGASAAASPAFASKGSWLSSATAMQPFARPWIRWWWPGGAVENTELDREIAVLKAAGFGGAEIQAFNPAVPNLTADERAHINDYANPTFFEHVKRCAEAAQKDRVQIDYTLGSAWPSGGGFAITPELALVELTPAITSITAPVSGPIVINLPVQTKKFGAMGGLDSRNRDPRASDWKARLEKRWKLIAIVAVKGTAAETDGKTFRDSRVLMPGQIAPGAGIVVTECLQPDGILNWTPPEAGPWQIIAFKRFTVDSSVMAGVGEGPQLVLDHFNKAAFEAHARRVGDPLDQLGTAKTAIRATFIDSLELMTDLHWSDDFPEQFQKRRGYDLMPYLPYLVQPGWMNPWNPRVSQPYYISDDTGDRVRADYRAVVSELLIENFWQPFVDWNHRHGFKARLQAHGGPSDVLCAYGLADIPETEDLGAGGNTHVLRLARAAADIYGRPVVSCESLCWIGTPYEVTPAQWLARANLLFVSGVNELVMHGFPYALHKEKWPGWFPFEPSPFLSGFSSQINEANPLWAAIPTLNAYLTRAQGLLQSGANIVPVAVLLTDIGYGSNPGEDKVEKWLQGLLDGGYDYDRINPDGLSKSKINGQSFISSGHARYSALIVPALNGLAPGLLDTLLRLAHSGVKVLFVDRVPDRSDSLRDSHVADATIRKGMDALQAAGAQVVGAEHISASLASAGVSPNVRFKSTPCLFIEKRHGDETLFVFHNTSSEAITLDCEVAAKGYPCLYDPFTGHLRGLALRTSGGLTMLKLDIEAGGASFVVFTPDRLKAPKVLATIDTRPGPQAWTLTLAGHGHRGRVVTGTQADFTLTDLSTTETLADFSGEAAYAATFDIDPAWQHDHASVWLDLGTVHDMARVTVNGTDFSATLAPPFQIDITQAIKTGSNALVIRTFNGPNNAMMDLKLPGLKDLKLKPAGLVGPVNLIMKA